MTSIVNKNEIRLAIVGSRFFENYQLFEATVQQWIQENDKPTMIISGGANGADQLAKRFATENEIEFTEFKADWSRGKRAGPERNTKIVNACTHLIAFPSRTGKGTQNTIKQASVANIPLKYIFVD